jgi:hypothetical protein
VADLAQGKVWNFDEVEEWGERNGRTKGCGPRRRVAQ